VGLNKPSFAHTSPLEQIVRAQKDFMKKPFSGKLVIVPFWSESGSMYLIHKIVLGFILIGMAASPIEAGQKTDQSAFQSETNWHQLHAGLELGIFVSPRSSEVGDSMVRALRIDPNQFELKLLNASAPDQGQTLTAREWCRRNGLVAAINASMYQKDRKTSVSLMRTKTHINNPRLSKDMAVLAFDRKSQGVPPVKIIDRQCEDFQTWKNLYRTFVQSIRMISCHGKNMWAQQPKKWSTAAIGIDGQGKILFIHVRSPYSTHDLINILKKLPLDISRAMYVEGGPEAQLYIRTDHHEFEFVGSFETNFNENSNNTYAWPVPNVIGISLRKAPEN
jgi:uncharacterized protein YigE (DUF2233 family)